MSNKIDLTGQTFGMLTVLCESNKRPWGKRRVMWECKCVCGETTLTSTSNLRGKKSERCNNWQRHPRNKKPITNTYTLIEDRVLVMCASGYKFIIDYSDFDFIKNHDWYINKNGYVYTTIKEKHYALHRLLLNAGEFEEVDHLSGKTSDYRRANLRKCTHAENQRNTKIRRQNKTGYKGVILPNGRKKYSASITFSGKTKYLGAYNTPEEAAAAYDKAAVSLYGEFARTNVMLGLLEVENENSKAI